MCLWDSCLANRFELKRWHRSGYVFLAIVTLLLVGSVAAQSQCDDANALRKEKLYEAARSTYIELLKNETTRGCAQDGLQTLNQEQAVYLFEQGSVFEKSNQVNAAHDAYVEALKIDPNNSAAKEALFRVNGGAFRYGLNSIYNGLSLLVEAVALSLGIILFFYAVIWRIHPWIRDLCKPRLNINEFDKGATNLEIGKGLGAMVEEKIKSFEKESHPSQEFRLVTGPIGKLEIPVDVKSATPQIKILSELLEWLFPPNVITLSGYLEKQGDQGVGLTLSLVTNQTEEIIGSQTFWQEEYDPTTAQPANDDPEPYYHLVEPIAIWTVFQLSTSPNVKNGILFSLIRQVCSRVHQISPCEDYLIRHIDEFKILNTKNWQSYAYFRAGARLGQERKTDLAREMYLKALKEDPDNVGALLNLSSSYSKDEDYGRVLSILGRVNEFIKPDEPQYGFTWYTYKYQLSITFHYIAIKYSESLILSFEKIEALNKIIEKSIEAKKQKYDDALLKCYLGRAGEEADILVETIYKFKKALQDHYESIDYGKNDKTNDNKDNNKKQENYDNELIDILKHAKNMQETIDKLKKNLAKISQNELISAKSKIEKLGEKIEKMKNNSRYVFKSNLEKAKKESIDLVETMQKTIGKLPSVEDESKNLLNSITNALDEFQNKNNVLECIKRANTLEETIAKAASAFQNNKNKMLKCYLHESRKMVKKITGILTKEEVGSEDRLKRAKKVAEKLDRRIRLIVNEAGKSENKALKSFLRSFEPMAICVKEEILADLKETGLEKPIIQKKFSEYNPGFLYNKACYYSVAGEKQKDMNERIKKFKKTLKYLSLALEQERAYIKWAQKDPSLKGIREDELTKDEFIEIIKKYGTPEEEKDSLPLSGLRSVGKTYASLLKKQRILSYCDLIRVAAIPQARVNLANELGIRAQLLERWALLADLMRIVGNAGYVSLLEEADKGSIEALKNVNDPCELSDLLNQINQAMSLVQRTPSIEIVQQWINEARGTVQLVK